MGTEISIVTLFMTILPIYLIYVAVRVIKSKENKKREIIKGLFGVYILALIGVTLFPIQIGGQHNALSLAEKANINLLPFASYARSGVRMMSVVKGVGGNAILLMPLVVFMFILNERFRTLKSSFLLAFIVSALIELTQLISNITSLSFGSRTVDIEDIILNTLGGVIAYVICNYAYKKFKKEKNEE